MAVLRGVCQIPAYVAFEKGFFKKQKLDVSLEIASTAWLIPQRMENGQSDFALLPWTRVAAADEKESKLVIIAGSGIEEAAILVRKGMNIADVKSVVVPLRGGMKDLTAMSMIQSLGLKDIKILRQPSGDGAIISFFGSGADAASMVEPYATMLENMGVGTIVKRTGDLWPGAPGCSLATSVTLTREKPETVQQFVNAFKSAIDFIYQNPDESARIAHPYIGINPDHIASALARNRPDINAIRNQRAMNQVLEMMKSLGYIKKLPQNYSDLSFLDMAQA